MDRQEIREGRRPHGKEAGSWKEGLTLREWNGGQPEYIGEEEIEAEYVGPSTFLARITGRISEKMRPMGRGRDFL